MANLLYIEDDQISALIVSKFLENQHDVTVAKTGLLALELLYKNSFDLILMDMCLGGKVEGLELLNQIRSSGISDDVKVIAFTAHALPGDEARFLAMGFDTYLAKPVSRAHLREAVNQLLCEESFAPLVF